MDQIHWILAALVLAIGVFAFLRWREAARLKRDLLQEVDKRIESERSLLASAEAVRESEKTLLEAQRIARIGDYRLDVRTSEMRLSAAVYELLGYEPGEKIDYARVNSEIRHPDDVERVSQWLEECIASGSSELTPNEYRAIRKDGSVIWVRSHGVIRRGEAGDIRVFGTLQDITDLKRAAEQRALSVRLRSVREEERARIARELHDELGQALTVLKFDLASLGRKIERGEPEALVDKVGSMTAYVDETIQMVRTISTELRPRVLDEADLIQALEWQAREFERRTGIRCAFESDDPKLPLGDEWSTAVFRIFQEILTNVARHSEANGVDAVLRRRNGWLELVVSDDGRGISTDDIERSGSLGIVGMQERAHALGGEVRLEGRAAGGTVVTVHIPVENAEGIRTAGTS